MESMSSDTKRSLFISYGSALVIGVIVPVITKSWIWSTVAVLVGIGLVVHGHVPSFFTRKRLVVGVTVFLFAGGLVGLGYYLGYRESKQAVSASSGPDKTPPKSQQPAIPATTKHVELPKVQQAAKVAPKSGEEHIVSRNLPKKKEVEPPTNQQPLQESKRTTETAPAPSQASLPAGGQASQSGNAIGSVTVQPGGAVSFQQHGGNTAGVVNISSLPPFPGYGMLVTANVDYRGKPLVYLEKQQISAEDKQDGSYYVAVFLSLKTEYQKEERSEEIEKDLALIRNIPGVKLFYTPRPGGYTLIKNGVATITGGNISKIGEQSIITYFSTSSESLAKRIGEALHLKTVPIHLDPNANNVGFLMAYDIWTTSGIDIEVVL
jgi:hypothetical protein